MTLHQQSDVRCDVIDAVRGLCAAFVVVHHILLSWTGDWRNIAHGLLYYTPLEALFSGGKFVRMFFVISGYALYLVYAKDPTWNSVGFYIRRLVRIWLPYFAVSIVCVLVLHVSSISQVDSPFSQWLTVDARPSALSTGLWLAHLAMLGRHASTAINCATWSLVLEVRFVLLFPLLALAVARCDLLTLFIAYLAASGADIGYVALNEQGYFTTAETLYGAVCTTLHFLPFFVVGMVAAKRHDAVLAALGGMRPLSVIALWLLALVCIRRTQEVVASAGTVLLLILLLRSGRFASFARNNFPRWLGKLSYSLYLVHMPVLILFAYLFGDVLPQPAVLVAAFFASIATAHLFTATITRPSAALAKLLDPKAVSPCVISSSLSSQGHHPKASRSAIHHLLQRDTISRLADLEPGAEGEKPEKSFADYE
jgi:peptidoglycan/LPS O-acetylase OafA/YrhL